MLPFCKICDILSFIGNENKQMWFASPKEVRRMIENTLIATIYILFYSLILVTVITIALIIALTVILCKSDQ